ncbi:MAG: hypothetical protein NC347_02900 [Clostridium sp.]|nr:hypothetical protein [Clostridium sp.]
MKNTPYDDVFRTLLNDCSQLIIPIINETFHENYSGDKKILFYPNEHFLNRQDGVEVERITDTCFIVEDDIIKKYHWECQSIADNSMLVRIFEYDAQIALDDGEVTGDVLTVKFPNSAILYLRSNSQTPDYLKIYIQTPSGEIVYNVPALKMQRYSIRKIFDKQLLFLIPFYIFSHESRFPEYDKDRSKLEALLDEYEYIKNRLEELCNSSVIDEFTKCTIIDMSNNVLEHLAKNYDEVVKGVKSVMGGKVLDYEAKQIKNEGILETLVGLVKDGLLPIEEAAKRLQISVDELKALL